MDVDGTLTDGGIYIGVSGENMKCFNVKDGYGIAMLLPQMNIVPIVITGRVSDIVTNRCNEIGITYVVQGSKNKPKDMFEILRELGIKAEETAYIGDDLNDLECMKMVGLKGCPKDAVTEVKNICDYISDYDGGHGAVRDFIDWILVKYCIGLENIISHILGT
jgi:3-deoxy-D-manno-octulosonate 8-phosphate phosphatase (KDO 8-P phosphatase)